MPYFFLYSALPEYSTVAQCGFEHLPCLYSIRLRITRFQTSKNFIKPLKGNLSEAGINCIECYMNCGGTVVTSLHHVTYELAFILFSFQGYTDLVHSSNSRVDRKIEKSSGAL